MKRRDFIAGLGSAVAWPLAARAQQAAVPVIGFLSAQSADDDYKNFTVPFLQGLKDTGYVDGQNVAVEYRYAENQMPSRQGQRSEDRHKSVTMRQQALAALVKSEIARWTPITKAAN